MFLKPIYEKYKKHSDSTQCTEESLRPRFVVLFFSAMLSVKIFRTTENKERTEEFIPLRSELKQERTPLFKPI